MPEKKKKKNLWYQFPENCLINEGQAKEHPSQNTESWIDLKEFKQQEQKLVIKNTGLPEDLSISIPQPC